MKKRILYCTALTVLAIISWAQGSLQEIYQDGMRAYESGNHELFLDKMIAADSIRSNHPTILYNLSIGYALTNDKEAAVETLRRVLWMNANLPYATDEDLGILQGYTPFEELKEEIAALKSPVSKGTLAFSLDDKELHPEGIAYSADQETFYIGGVRARKIVSVDKKGTVKDFAADDRLMAIMGLQVDEKRNLLWVCSTPAPEMSQYEKDLVAEVLSYNLASCELVGSYAAPHPEAWLGDLLVSDDGAVYVSSSSAEKPAIYKVNEDEETLEILVEPEGLISLQGLALNADESVLFFSDYRYGLFSYNLSSAKLDPITSKINHPLKGIDGLYFHEGDLIGIHNGLRPHRIVRYKLDKKGTEILDYEFVEKALTEMNEPTLGTIVGDEFYYIVNSPWGAYDENKQLKIEEVEQPMVRKVKLKD